MADTDTKDDAEVSDSRERLNDADARIAELEAQLAEARAEQQEAMRVMQAEAIEAAAPKVETRKRKRDFTLEVKPPWPVNLADRTLLPGDTVKASELQEIMGEHPLTHLLTMGRFKVLDKDFERGKYHTDELRGDQAVHIATGIPLERPTIVGEDTEEAERKWREEAEILERIRKENEEQGVKDNQQRILDQQTAEIARFADAKAAMRVDEHGRTPDPGVQLTTAGGPVVEDGEIVNPGTPFVEAVPSDDDEFVDAGDDDDDEGKGEPEKHAGTPSDPQTPEEQRFDSEAVADMTVNEVKEYVDTFPAERRDEILMKVFDVETAGKNRSTLISWIEDELGE